MEFRESEYLTFLLVEPDDSRKTRIVLVQNKRSHAVLGSIRLYPAWRQFVFWPERGTLFNPQCMREVIEVCELMTNEWRATQRKGGVS